MADMWPCTFRPRHMCRKMYIPNPTHNKPVHLQGCLVCLSLMLLPVHYSVRYSPSHTSPPTTSSDN